MAWIFLAESEASASHSEITSDLSPIVKATPIVKESCLVAKPRATFNVRRYGMMCEPFQQRDYGNSLMWFMLAFHARTSVLQDLEKAWKESEADYFSRSSGSVARLSQDLSFWKMCLPLLPEVEQKWSDKLPRWGMIVDGVLYPLQALERYTVGKDGSYWLTPSTMEHLPMRSGEALENALHRGKGRESRRKVSGRLNEQVAYPQMWPTPRANKIGGYSSKNFSPTLEQKVKMLPTPQARDWKGKTGKNRKSLNLPDIVSGHLNPQWVAWLMGYPTTWTDLEPWAIQWFLSKRKKRSKS